MAKASLLTRISLLGTTLFTNFSGRLVGADTRGNRYYEEKKAVKGRKARRWVIYAGEPQASEVPPEWHGWLHYTLPSPLPENSGFHKKWVKPHKPNLSGTSEAYMPPGARATGQRPHATGDYEAWVPEE